MGLNPIRVYKGSWKRPKTLVAVSAKAWTLMGGFGEIGIMIFVADSF